MWNFKMLNSCCINFYDSAVVMPLKDRLSGVFADGNLLPESRLLRHGEVIIDKADYCPSPVYGGKCAIYGGYLFGHYGHFVLESLSRLWAIQSLGKYPIVFASRINSLRSWQREIFNILGVENVIIIKKPTCFDELIVPSPGFQMADFFTSKHARYLEKQECKVTKRKKLWLSRSSFRKKIHHADIVNESDIEHHLSNKGWEIIHPQNYDISEQLLILSEANSIAGIAGSAFHTLLFLKDYQGKVDIINRPGWHQTNSPIKTYTMIAETKKLKQQVHNLNFKPMTSGNQKGKILTNLAYLYDSLDADG